MNYGEAGPSNPITLWKRHRLSVQQRSDVNTLLGILRNQRQWNKTDFRPQLQGYDGISEIKLKSENVQIRLVGCFKPGFEYVILIGCTHKGTVYDPHACLDTAQRRKREIDRKEISTSEHSVSDDEGPEEETLS
jgi:hypothetical protein